MAGRSFLKYLILPMPFFVFPVLLCELHKPNGKSRQVDKIIVSSQL